MNYSKIDAILFDLDGVLVDACEWHYIALNRALLDFGYDEITPSDHHQKYNGLPTKIKLDMLGIPQDKASLINNRKQQITFDIISKNASIMEEKIILHEYLKNNNIKICCVTNSIRSTATEMLKCTGQLKYFDLLICNEDVDKNKPNPECYDLAISKLNVDGTKTMCVEDSEKGILAAKSSKASHVMIVNSTKDVNINNVCEFIRRICL